MDVITRLQQIPLVMRLVTNFMVKTGILGQFQAMKTMLNYSDLERSVKLEDNG